MRTLLFTLFCFSITLSYAQVVTNKDVKSEITDVTVYLQGALETRKAQVDLMPGKTILKFVDLSSYADGKSLQIKANSAITINSINLKQDYLSENEKSPALLALESKLKEAQNKARLEETYLSVIQEDIEFLKQNRNLSGKDQPLSLTALKESSDFFSNRLTSLKLKEIEKNKSLEEIYKQINSIQNEINNYENSKDKSTGEVYVEVDSKTAVKAGFELTYMVSNAGWFPSYDIRAKDLSTPVQIAYKANIRQNTNKDWKNVRLKLSSYNPNVSGVVPELLPYYLDYGVNPPVYKSGISNVRGNVYGPNREPLAGVTVRVEGTNIATVTNAEGNYSITLPANAKVLNFESIGYRTSNVRITGNVHNVYLREDVVVLAETAVTRQLNTSDFKGLQVTSVDEALQGKIAGLDITNNSKAIRGMGLIPEQKQVQRQVSVEFEIKNPYTVNSGNNIATVDMQILSLPAEFVYYSIPKINNEAYLTANINDWTQYNFLEGEANVFFEDTYVGKTILDANSSSDTISISLGRDRLISVKRENIKSYSSRQFIGSRSEISKEWKTTIRNNRNEKIKMILMDQIPVSTNSEIEVSLLESSQAKPDMNGILKWNLEINQTETKTVNLKYSVKYPKNKILTIE